MPAAQQTHVGIKSKVPCKATLQRLELMALDEPSTLLLISTVASCLADSAVAFPQPHGPTMYTMPESCSIYVRISQDRMYQNAVLLLQVRPQH